MDRLAAEFLPEISAHLAAHHYGTEVYAPPFIPSLFVGRLPRNAGARILDIFLCEGDSIISRLFLGLLKYCEDQILAAEPEKILDILNKACDTVDMQQWLWLTFTFPVTQVGLRVRVSGVAPHLPATPTSHRGAVHPDGHWVDQAAVGRGVGES